MIIGTDVSIDVSMSQPLFFVVTQRAMLEPA
jgi:hypothetical protein